MLERIQTAVVVTLLAILIWLYAEAQNPAVPLDQEVTVQLLPPPGSDLRVRLDSTDRLSLLLTGPNAELQELKKQLRLQQNSLRLTLGEFGLPTTPGDYKEPIINYLEEHPLFKNSRIRVQTKESNVLVFTVYAMAERTFNIESGALPNVQTEGPIVIDPTTVKVRIPANILNTLNEDALKVIAVPRLQAGQVYKPGVPYTLDATLTMPGIADPSAIEFPPGPVRLTFTVHTTRTELAVPNVPIRIVLLPVDQNRYDITISEPLIAELKIAGPSDLITRIRDGSIRITGEAVFSSDELTQQITTKLISFDHLPDSLSILSAPITIAVTITRRQAQTNE